MMQLLKARAETFLQYRHLIRELVIKDIKLKYRRSFLGYFWSILNPLMIMAIMVIVFSNMFRFDIENFPVYLIIGQTLFNFLTESTTQSIFSITGNAALLKKTYVPKYAFTMSKVTSSLINLLFSLGAMVIVFLFCRVRFTFLFLWIPFILLQVYLFCLGLGLFLAQAAVFFRDVQYIYNAVTTAWMYLTPLFYPIETLPEYLRQMIMVYNPLYNYIFQFRMVVMYGSFPDAATILSGVMFAVFSVLIGSWCFLNTQDQFILYI